MNFDFDFLYMEDINSRCRTRSLLTAKFGGIIRGMIRGEGEIYFIVQKYLFFIFSSRIERNEGRSTRVGKGEIVSFDGNDSEKNEKKKSRTTVYNYL